MRVTLRLHVASSGSSVGLTRARNGEKEDQLQLANAPVTTCGITYILHVLAGILVVYHGKVLP